jgi:hydroxymethylpyrimidine/phosphomethylpyrimidine kinase
MRRYPTVLTIAGSDSSGGAGIQADLKTIAALGAYGASALTALTAQNTRGVRAIQAVSPEFLRQQLEAVFDDLQIDAVKIGMVNTPEVAHTVAAMLDAYRPPFVVFDPVMVATSGSRLIEDRTIDELWNTLFPRVDLITPNLDEAELLVGRKLDSVEDMKEAAAQLVQRGCNGILLKGGHLVDKRIYDVLALKQETIRVYESDYIDSPNLHGTGCTLSSAIATCMALGNDLPESIRLAREFVSGAIRAGKNVITGRGHGPLNHTFQPQPMQLK